MVKRRAADRDLRDGYDDGWPPSSPVGRFLDDVRNGQVVNVAALVNELDPAVVGQWADRGATLLTRAAGRLERITRTQRPFAAFAVELARAEAANEAGMVRTIVEHARSDAGDRWRAAAWILEHHRRAAPARPEPDDEDEDVTSLSTPVRDTADD